MADNVYAPLPRSAERSGLYTEDQCVVSPVHATWPERCVVCNRADQLEPATFRPRHVSMWAWILLPGWAVIASLLPSARVRIVASVCGAHARRRNGARWAAIGVAAMGFAALFFPYGEFVAVPLFVVSAIVLLLPGVQPIRVSDLEGDRGWFLVGDAFHASLPAKPTSRPSLELD